MAYPPRVFLKGYWYHFYARGQRGNPLFFSPKDRLLYLRTFDEVLVRFGGKMGTFCLMPNHVHFLLWMGEVPLSRVYHQVHTTYAKYFNEIRGTKGHVFQGRPGLKIILNDLYMRNLVIYIHFNPVMAGIAKSVTRFKWSSWSWFYGNQLPWIQLQSWTYPPGFPDENCRFVLSKDTCMEKDLWDKSSPYIGTWEEWERIEKRKQGRGARLVREKRCRTTKEEILELVLSRRGCTRQQVFGVTQMRNVSRARREAMALMHCEGHGVTEIARMFKRVPSTVTHAIKAWNSMGEED